MIRGIEIGGHSVASHGKGRTFPRLFPHGSALPGQFLVARLCRATQVPGSSGVTPFLSQGAVFSQVLP